ncbi:MAG: hypothetical protein JEZ04_22330 [Spirochaetales bacterium]|nr:hypothetical protein [Spirochaetales bacterium]
MKKNIFLGLMIFAVISMSSCLTFTSAAFNEVHEGNLLEQPLDQQKLQTAIKTTLLKFNWQITEIGEGYYNARFSKSNDLILADIKIVYDDESFKIIYISSKNLDYNERRHTIHRNYPRWINNLDKSISVSYIQQANS